MRAFALLTALSLTAASAQAASLAGGPAAAPAVASTAASGPLQMAPGQAARIALSRPADSVVVGSDDILGVTPVANSRTLAVTAKKAGATNILVLDAAGAVILDRQVQVAVNQPGGLTVFSGGGVSTSYACAPLCAPIGSSGAAVPAMPAAPASAGSATP